jgi:hypothetical protein
MFRDTHNHVGFNISLRFVAEFAEHGSALAEPCTKFSVAVLLKMKMKSTLH